MTAFRHGPKPVIGLIGGIGAGKTTAARCFAARGGMVIDADALGHEALRQPDIIAQVVERWGPGVRKPDGSLDRHAIGRIVFANADERNALESIVFPYIGKRCREGIERGLVDPEVRFIVLDAAVMLEAGWNNEVDRIVYISAPRDLRLGRLARRSGWIDADLAAREAAQWPEEVKQSRVDAVILNDADADALQGQVDELLKQWGLLAPRSL
jgi:dephospho-CoA kinase